MSAHHHSDINSTEVTCDGPSEVFDRCPTGFSAPGAVDRVRERARTSGWLVSLPGGTDYCSTACRNNAKEG